MATVPYLTEEQIKQKYADAYSAYDAQRKAEADRATAAANQQLANLQRGAYVDYRMNQRDLPEQLARQGITGGASETSALRGQMNYENNRAANSRQNANRLAEINNAYLDAMNTYKMTADQAMNDEIVQNQQLRANYEKQLQQEAEQRFSNTISGYDSISDIDKEIAKIQKSGVDLWKIDYLRARRAELKAAQEEAYSGGGGYSGYSGYTYDNDGGGGGGGGNTNAQVILDYYKSRGGLFGKGSGGGSSKSGGSGSGKVKVKGKASGIKVRSGSTKYYKNRKSGSSYRNSKKRSDYSWRK